jgi:DNA-binding MarR family transcriptional regulator
MSKADYEALADFRHSLRRFLHRTEENARATGITPQQHQILLAIKGQRGRDWASVGQLAEALQVRHHAAVGLVDRSEKAGLVHREGDPNDRRQVRVLLTEKGEEVLGRLSRENLAELRALREALRIPVLDEASVDPD